MVRDTIEIGSLESNDLTIEFYRDGEDNSLDVVNLVGSVDSELLYKEIETRLSQSLLKGGSFRIVYNGANGWVIQARIDALADLVGERDCLPP